MLACVYLDNGNDNAKEADGAAKDFHNQDLDEESTVLRIGEGATTVAEHGIEKM